MSDSPARRPSALGTARSLAAHVLERVFVDDAYAAAALSSALERSGLDARDRALATEIVYGVLRTERHLRRRIEAFGTPRGDAPLLFCHLLVAAYQIEFLDRVPVRAAVHEAVEMIQRAEGPRVGGFANAVLRRVADAVETSGLELDEAIWTSTPGWLRKRLEKSIGAEETRRLLTDVESPSPTLRLRAGEAVPEWFEAEAEALPLAPSAYRYRGGGDPRRHPEFARGAFVVQELGAQLVAHALGVRRGDSVFDVCAGRGHKTVLLAELAGPGARVVASDLHPHKLSRLTEESARLGVQAQTLAWDFTRPPPLELQGSFARVLVDAPCTGTGTLRRRPEILRRLGADDPARLGELQAAILRNAALLLAPDGALVFSTCSVLGAEGEDVLDRVRDVLAPRPFGETHAPRAFPRDESVLRLLPGSTGSDGYFVASLARTGNAL